MWAFLHQFFIKLLDQKYSGESIGNYQTKLDEGEELMKNVYIWVSDTHSEKNKA
jgi:hypothetical protein